MECVRCKKELAKKLFTKGSQVFKQCLPCRLGGRARFKKAYAKDRPTILARVEKWRQENPEKQRGIKSAISRRHRARYPERIAAQNRSYRRRNPGKVASLARAREAHVRRATPKWADLAAVEAVYTLALRLRAEGQDVHVDHTLPLRAKDVCGLHIAENLQIVSAVFNIRKKNKTVTKIRHEPRQTPEGSTTMGGMEVTEEILKIVQLYVDRNLTRARAASLLGISERQVTRIVEELNIVRVPSERALREEKASKHILAKNVAAHEVVAGRLTVKAAAQRAGCHERTITRRVELLLKGKKT